MWRVARSAPKLNESKDDERLILYLHTKGAGKELNLAVEHWVDLMMHFLVDRHCDCVQRLSRLNRDLGGHHCTQAVTCGVDLRTRPVLHYSGNFWWARADFIARLPSPWNLLDLAQSPNPFKSWRHNFEFWATNQTPGLIPMTMGNDSCVELIQTHTSIWQSGISVWARHRTAYPSTLYRLDLSVPAASQTGVSDLVPQPTGPELLSRLSQPASPRHLIQDYDAVCLHFDLSFSWDKDQASIPFFATSSSPRRPPEWRLEVPQHCEVLMLYQNGFPKEKLRAISKALPESPQLRSLVLSLNGINDEIAAELSAALRSSTSQVTTVDLHWNDITDDGAHALAEILRDSKAAPIHTLTLHGNLVSDRGAKAIAEALLDRGPASVCLRVLDLSANDIGDAGAEALAAALASRHTHLEELSLYRNRIGPRGHKLLQEAAHKKYVDDPRAAGLAHVFV